MAELLVIAERVLADPDSPESLVERIVMDICRVDIEAAVDQAVLRRVITALGARRSSLGEELADMGRERAALAHRHRGVAGYARSGG